MATIHAEIEEARDETQEWKRRAEEAEAKFEEREHERERGRDHEEFEEKVAGIERELAKVDAAEEEVERLKKEAGKGATGAAKACELLSSVTVERGRLAVELDQAKVRSFRGREGFEESWRSAQGAADYRPGHRTGGRSCSAGAGSCATCGQWPMAAEPKGERAWTRKPDVARTMVRLRVSCTLSHCTGRGCQRVMTLRRQPVVFLLCWCMVR